MRTLSFTLTVVANTILCVTAAAQSTYWIDLDVEGAWESAANWSHGVPAPAGTWIAYINNGGRAHVSVAGQGCAWLQLGEDSGESGAVRVSTGDLTITTGHVGCSGTGSILQTDGDVWFRDLCVGKNPGGHGAYELTGGTLDIYSVEYVGLGGTGSFIQTGGTHSVGTRMDIACNPDLDSSYELGGGELIVAGENVGFQGQATFDQTGGTHTVNGNLTMGAFSLDTAYALHAGELEAEWEWIGSCGAAAFTQTGGTHTVLNNLTLGNANALEYPNSRGTYLLQGGEVHVQGDLILANGSRDVLFIQADGTLTVDGAFYVGYWGAVNSDANATYTIYGGTLDVNTLHIGRAGCYGYFYHLGPGAAVSVSGLLLFDETAEFYALPGAKIHMTGAQFDIAGGVDPSSLSPGLRWLELIFEGGAGDIDTFEVAGQDLGPTMFGFHANGGNCALHALTLGGADVGQVQLVNNQEHHGTDEALYVNTLNVGPGSYLDLNGINLYYVQGYVDPGATIVNGSPTFLLAGDYDGDGVVGPADYQAMSGCFTGPAGGIEAGCSAFDFDTDHDVDLMDFAEFQVVYEGA